MSYQFATLRSVELEMPGGDDLKRAVEYQSGACRSLAISLDSWAENHALLTPAERKIVTGFAAQAAGIADALTEALASGDRGRLQQLWRWGGPVIGALALAIATGTSEGAAGNIFSAPPPASLEQQVSEISIRFEVDLPPSESNITVANPDTAQATGTANDAVAQTLDWNRDITAAEVAPAIIEIAGRDRTSIAHVAYEVTGSNSIAADFLGAAFEPDQAELDLVRARLADKPRIRELLEQALVPRAASFRAPDGPIARGYRQPDPNEILKHIPLELE